ncbi:histidine phosphatase family protein [Companilactobacillus sp. HBUAS59699]|uniref:histidine phosphatase family protein n=1 Tax=Companilactobacillus sp. HBUAS59699 TaxID=3109358 RepID=UPI002FF1BC85
MKVYFVRHGLTMFNKMDKMQGWSDTPLTDEGISVLKRTGDYLKNTHFDAIYSSDLKRAVDTANIIRDENLVSDADVQQSFNFREMCFGSFEGDNVAVVWKQIAAKYNCSTQEELASKFSEFIARGELKKADPLGIAEDASDVSVRIDRGLDQLRHENNPESTILVVSHGAYLETLVLKYFSDKYNLSNAFPDNGSITTTELTDNSFELDKFNLLP